MFELNFGQAILNQIFEWIIFGKIPGHWFLTHIDPPNLADLSRTIHSCCIHPAPRRCTTVSLFCIFLNDGFPYTKELGRWISNWYHWHLSKTFIFAPIKDQDMKSCSAAKLGSNVQILNGTQGIDTKIFELNKEACGLWDFLWQPFELQSFIWIGEFFGVRTFPLGK